MQSFKEQQGEIRKSSSAINAKKQRKTTEWEKLEISSRLLEIPGNISCKDGLDKEQKWYGPNRAEDSKKRWQEYTEQLYKKDLFFFNKVIIFYYFGFLIQTP